MRTRTSGRYYFVIVLGAAKVCLMELYDIVRGRSTLFYTIGEKQRKDGRTNG